MIKKGSSEIFWDIFCEKVTLEKLFMEYKHFSDGRHCCPPR